MQGPLSMWPFVTVIKRKWVKLIMTFMCTFFLTRLLLTYSRFGRFRSSHSLALFFLQCAGWFWKLTSKNLTSLCSDWNTVLNLSFSTPRILLSSLECSHTCMMCNIYIQLTWVAVWGENCLSASAFGVLAEVADFAETGLPQLPEVLGPYQSITGSWRATFAPIFHIPQNYFPEKCYFDRKNIPMYWPVLF